MKKDNIEIRIEELEEYLQSELDSIKKLIKKVNPKQNIIEVRDLFSITTYQQVCIALKEQEQACPYARIKQIEKLFNGNWIKDWNNNEQKKWYPYFRMNTSDGSVGFFGSCYYSYGALGQVAFYKNQATSDHIGRNFWSIYKELM